MIRGSIQWKYINSILSKDARIGSRRALKKQIKHISKAWRSIQPNNSPFVVFFLEQKAYNIVKNFICVWIVSKVKNA